MSRLLQVPARLRQQLRQGNRTNKSDGTNRTNTTNLLIGITTVTSIFSGALFGEDSHNVFAAVWKFVTTGTATMKISSSVTGNTLYSSMPPTGTRWTDGLVGYWSFNGPDVDWSAAALEHYQLTRRE